MFPPSTSKPDVPAHNALPADKQITIYVLLAGMAGGLLLAFVVMVCCKFCVKKKKRIVRQHVVFDRGSDRQHTRGRKYHSLDSSISVDIETSCSYSDNFLLSRESKEYDPESVIESETTQSWPPQALPDSIPEALGADIELQDLRTRGIIHAKNSDDPSDASSPERPPEVTSAVRRRSSVGIQRQASVCLSDEDDQEELGTLVRKPTAPRKQEVSKVSAVVHHSGNDKPLAHSWEQKSAGKTISPQTVGIRHPPFIHSHSSPDSRSTTTMLEIKQGRQPSTFSLRGVAADTLARVIDLEDYHYSRQQLWELASQGATLLKEKSQSSLDVAIADGGWDEGHLQIQQAASTEAGLLEQSLEQHQLENMRTLLRCFSPVDEEDTRSWSKVRYNDTGSREDIRDEVIEIISGESEDDSSSSLESEIGKQQYKKLWELRATLEEKEDELSDTQEAEIVVPLAQPEDCEHYVSPTTSFDSNTEGVCEDIAEIDDCDEGLCEYLQLPLHELRRHCYKSMFTKRLQRRTPSDRVTSGCGGENSFESVESSSTDRTEDATTSFESTTDNTDSTGEGQTNRLQQMKADSGYKSIESNGKAPRLSRKQLQFALDADSLDVMLTVEDSVEEEALSFDFSKDEGGEKEITKSKCIIDTAKEVVFESGVTGIEIPVIIETVSEKKKCKSALKKHYTEGDAPWSYQQTIPEISDSRNKTSVFQRFFRSGRLRVDQLHFYRDYSIDEKSDTLFREFSRPEIPETEIHRSRGGRLHGHIRHHHHHRSLPPTETCSPLLARKVLSPQLSIEEESCESGDEHQSRSEKKSAVIGHVEEELKSPCENQAQIPVIHLSQVSGERPT